MKKRKDGPERAVGIAIEIDEKKDNKTGKKIAGTGKITITGSADEIRKLATSIVESVKRAYASVK